jgi:hypothetical protein
MFENAFAIGYINSNASAIANAIANAIFILASTSG